MMNKSITHINIRRVEELRRRANKVILGISPCKIRRDA